MSQEAVGALYRHFAGSSDIRIHSDSLQALKPLIRAQSNLCLQEGLSADPQVLNRLDDATILERLDNLVVFVPLAVIRS